ncbi:MAG: hypothetical protein LIP16_16410 [Clostridium sp.]|nr:hypothetical protein [Clostridium sp.]
MANLLEILMLLCFGASWPINFRKALIAGTTKGTSLAFLLLVEIGYLCGMAAKILSDNINYVLIFYGMNLAVVAANIGIYFVNRKKENRTQNITQ